MAGQSAVTSEEQRPKVLLTQVRACPACPERSRGELGEGMPSA
jgi:hypothetical protein